LDATIVLLYKGLKILDIFITCIKTYSAIKLTYQALN